MFKQKVNKTNQNVVSCVLPSDYKMQLSILAKVEGMSISELARSVLMAYMNKHSVMQIVIDYMTEMTKK